METKREILIKHAPRNEDGQPLKYENDHVLVCKAEAAMEEYAQQFRQAAVSVPLPPIEIEYWPGGIDDTGAYVPSDYVASWPAFKGMVVSAPTKEKAIDELMTSIRVKLLSDMSVRVRGNER